MENTYTKTPNFIVFVRKNFSDPKFDNLQVAIQLSVTEINRKDKVPIAKLCDSTLSQRSIKEYPCPEAKALKLSQQFTGIKDSTELVKVAHSINTERETAANLHIYHHQF